MLAVILTKSFRCSFHSEVYMSLFFCVLEFLFLVQPSSPCGLSYNLSAVIGAFLMVHRIHWTYANSELVFPSVFVA